MIYPRITRSRFASIAACLAAFTAMGVLSPSAWGQSSLSKVVGETQPKIVKIYGAGGLRGLQPYQSGFLISPEGHILTVWSYVLDTDYITVTLNDGRKFDAEVAGHDPQLEIAVLKIKADGLPHFDLHAAATPQVGDRVLAFSNLFGVAAGNEPASVLHGNVSAIARLDARRGAFQTPYKGPAYIVDAMTNNPGAQGGAMTDRNGRLVGLLGKELRNAQSNVWLNFAMPAGELVESVDAILAGRAPSLSRPMDDRRLALRPMTLSTLGVVLVPNVLPKTPPFVDHVRPNSPAERAGILPDDLIVFMGDAMINSRKVLEDELATVEDDERITLIVLRGQELLTVELNP